MSNPTLDHLTLLKISGADAASFLQGQLTNDVNQLSEDWDYSGYCSPKGRLLALLTLWKNEEDFYALMHNSLTASVIPRLKMFVMRSKVGIEVLERAIILPQLPVANLATERASPADDSSALSQRMHAVKKIENRYYLSFGERGLWVDPLGELSADGAHTADNMSLHWQQLDIAAGLPSVTIETQEMFVPQMLNLDLLDGLSFKKGCYTGQEIVARMHYLGKLKQRMFVCSASRGSGGEKVLSDEQKNAGNLASPVINGVCLAVLRLDHINAPLRLESGDVLEVLKTQPYALNPSKETDSTA